jgi:hypothetical protein
VAIRFQQSKTSVIRLYAMPKVLALMEKTPCMNEDDHIKQFLRFTSEDELIRLAEIGLAVEMHQVTQRFFHGRTDVPSESPVGVGGAVTLRCDSFGTFSDRSISKTPEAQASFALFDALEESERSFLS